MPCIPGSSLASLSSLSALHSLIISQCIGTCALLWLSCLYSDEQSSHHSSSFLGPLGFLTKQDTSLLSHFLLGQWEQKMQSPRRILQHIDHVPGDEWDVSTTVHELFTSKTSKGISALLAGQGNHAPCDLNKVFKKLGADNWELGKQEGELKKQVPLPKEFFKLKLEPVEFDLKPLPLAHAKEVKLFHSHPI